MGRAARIACNYVNQGRLGAGAAALVRSMGNRAGQA